MRKTILYVSTLLTIISFSACDRGDNLYIDPSRPEEASAQTMLTALEVNTFMNVTADLSRVSSILCEQMAGSGSQYVDLQNYDILGGDYNNQWNGLYAGTMYNAKLLINQYAVGRPHYSGIGKVLLALNLGVATDLWGDVPYSESFQGAANLTPKFDPQKDVLDSIQSLLDQAILELSTSDDENAEFVADDDLIYSGDIDQWINAAWVLKARYANRLSLKDPVGSANKVLEYLSNVDAEFYSSLEAVYDGTSPNQWQAFQADRAGNMVSNKVFVDALKAKNDPRLSYFFSKNSTGEIVGADITEQTVSTAASTINTSAGGYFNIARNAPMVAVFEIYFLMAEAQNRLGLNASEALNNGIKASVAYVTGGVDDGASLATYTSATKTDIMTEKWKAMFGQIEAYSDFRRTGLPALTPRPESAGAIRSYIPKRLPIPTDERLGNPENAKFVELDVPVWWAQP